MKKLSKLNLGLLVFSLLIGSVALSFSKSNISNIQPASAWSGAQTSNEGTYFSSVGSETGSALRSKLQGIISNGTSEDYDWSRYEAADEAENQSSKVLLIYSRQIVAKSAHVAGSTGWNREHSFAKSLFGESAPAVNDNHHIFADDNKTNGQRGNKPFNELNPSTSTRSIDSYGNTTDNYYTGSYFMPNDLAKGEVARATMYMNTRYGYSITLNFYSVELMLQWHLEHPVTNREVYRNNTVQSLQKNRNPYIDHGDWACKVYSSTNAATQNLCNAVTEPVTPTGVSVSPTTATVNVGSTLLLNATVAPTGASQAVNWTSSNNAVATVSNGTVTPISAGQATITARSSENSSLLATATITVTNIPVSVSGISLDKEIVNLGIDAASQVNAIISPSNASNKNVNWTSSNQSIATVSNSGLISAIAIGSANITATTVDGGFSDSVIVNVSENTQPEPLENFTFTNTGNTNWPTASGFITYFTSGYGVDKAGGYTKSIKLVDDLPLGSMFSLTIAAVTNSASNNTVITVYGLDSLGNRIAGVSESTITPSNSSGDLVNQQTFARNNTRVINLPVSTSKKVNSFEVTFASSSSKTLLVDINIDYALGSAQTQAQAYAGFINTDEGLNAKGSCESALTILDDEYAMLSTSARSLFLTESSQTFVDARLRINYMQAWVSAKSGVNSHVTLVYKNENIVAVILIAILAITAVTGYYFIHKRKNQQRHK